MKIRQMKKFFSKLLILSLLLVMQNASFAQEEQDYKYYYTLGYAELVDGDFAKSVNVFNKAISINPEAVEAYIGLGIAYRQLNQLDKALEATKKALEYDPSYYKAYYNLGLTYEQQGKMKEAVKAYSIFYKKVPEAKNIPDLKEKIQRLKNQT
ncbi:MAG: tetratricopeptide repeat protein [Vampirovibrionia bacterium]